MSLSFLVPEGLQKPVVEGVNSSVMSISWEEPAFPNGPRPIYSVEKTTPALSYPPQVIRGTRFPGGGYYLFPPDTVPANVEFTGTVILSLLVLCWIEIPAGKILKHFLSFFFSGGSLHKMLHPDSIFCENKNNIINMSSAKCAKNMQNFHQIVVISDKVREMFSHLLKLFWLIGP